MTEIFQNVAAACLFLFQTLWKQSAALPHQEALAIPQHQRAPSLSPLDPAPLLWYGYPGFLAIDRMAPSKEDECFQLCLQLLPTPCKKKNSSSSMSLKTAGNKVGLTVALAALLPSGRIWIEV